MTDSSTGMFTIRGGRTIDCTGRTLVMGIVNCTPDSFYPASRAPGVEDGLSAACRMVEEGADIIDVGGESTRPGAEYVSPEEQIARVIPVVEGIRARYSLPISIDTRSAAVARAALDAGADIVNDVSGLADDVMMVETVVETGAGTIIMHMRGTSKTMQNKPYYEDTIGEIRSELGRRVEAAIAAGVRGESIMIDPGIGFGKRAQDNLRIVRDIDAFAAMGYPVLLGVSRKSFLETVLARRVEDRLPGTLAAEAWAVLHGVDVLRVHDVAATVDLVRMVEAIRSEPT